MFSGIVERVGVVTHQERAGEASRLVLSTSFADLVLGESVAVNGVCLTVAELLSSGEALFFVGHVTLAQTNLGALRAGDEVNLERALPAGGRLSGHIVQGHVDGLATITRLEARGESRDLEILLEPELGRYCVEKGSIALDGVSLTLARVEDTPRGTHASIMVIPHTWNHTRLRRLEAGARINVEVDLLAKYMERLCRPYLKP